MTIQIEVTPDALHLTVSNPALPDKVLQGLGASIPRDAEGTFEAGDVTELLKAIKQRYPASDTMIVLPEPGTAYRDVIDVLDVARDYETEEGRKVPLFPVVVMSRKVRG